MADGSGSFSSHLVMPDSPKLKTTPRLANIRESADLDEKRVLPELDSDNPENVSTPTRTLGSVEFDTNSDSEKLHFSETLGRYLTHLKTIKHPKIKNSKLLDGVNRVSRSIEGCIKLAETALGSSTSQQNPEVLNPPQKRSGDILSGIDRVNSKLADCIKIAESTPQNKEEESRGGICGGSGETNPRLVRMGPPISRIPQSPSPKPTHIRTPQAASRRPLRKFLTIIMIRKLVASTLLWDPFIALLDVRKWRIQKHGIGHGFRISSTHI
jgi:hypothetical protein